MLVVTALALARAVEPALPDESAGVFASRRGFTLVNLHPDNARSRSYAANQRQAGSIPVCSEIEYLGLEEDSLRFRLIAKAAAGPFADRLARFFGENCPSREISFGPDERVTHIRD